MKLQMTMTNLVSKTLWHQEYLYIGHVHYNNSPENERNKTSTKESCDKLWQTRKWVVLKSCAFFRVHL